MNMTKRDIADIVLAGIGVSLCFRLVTSFVTLGAFIGLSGEAAQYTNKSTAIIFQSAHFFFILLLIYLLLLHRSIILSAVFPDARTKDLTVPDNLTALTSYPFWVKLFGIFIVLQSSIAFLSQLVSDLAIKRQYAGGSFWMMKSGVELVSAILAAVVIWKADWIAGLLERKNLSNNRMDDTSL